MRCCWQLIRWCSYRFAIARRWVVCAVLALGIFDALPLLAAQAYVIRSEKQYLHLWSGPETAYHVLSSLPNGVNVVVHEYRREWSKIAPLAQPATEGWVMKRDLVAERRTTSTMLEALDKEQEQRRFGRLRRKGVLSVQRTVGGVLRLTMSHLLWHRLPSIQQENFLRRAQQFFGGSVVEMLDPRNATLMGRLTAAGELEVPLLSVSPPPLLDDSSLRTPTRPIRLESGQ